MSLLLYNSINTIGGGKMKKGLKEMDMTNGALPKKIFLFYLPILGAGLLQLFYNACDLIVCGKFGSSHSVAAISATNPLINLIINLFLGLSIGSNVIMAICYGKKDREGADKVIHTSILFAMIIGVVIGLFGFFLSDIFLEWMKTPDDVLSISADYLKIYFLGLPFLMIYNFGSSIMRANGDAKRPFIYLSIAGIVNIGLNLILVICFNMDVKGVAIATISSEALSSVLIIISLMRNKGFCKLSLSKLRLHKKEAFDILKVGLPAGIQGSIFAISNVLIQSSVNSLGSFIMDGNGAAASIESFQYTSMNSVALACVAFVSANYGAQKMDNIKKTIFFSYFLVFVVGGLMGGAMLLLAKPLLGIYLNNSEAIEAGYLRMYVLCLTYFICGFMDISAYSIRGLGKSIIPAIVTLIGACGLRIIWLYTVFKIEACHNLPWLMASYPISWILTALVLIMCLIHVYKKMKRKACQNMI